MKLATTSALLLLPLLAASPACTLEGVCIGDCPETAPADPDGSDTEGTGGSGVFDTDGPLTAGPTSPTAGTAGTMSTASATMGPGTESATMGSATESMGTDTDGASMGTDGSGSATMGTETEGATTMVALDSSTGA